MVHTCLYYLWKEALNRRILVQVNLSKKQDSISKITRVKRTVGAAQAVESRCKCNTLSSNPQYHQKTKKKE
jgi:hypothetical protein